MSDLTDLDAPEGLSRRTVLAGTAWAVPAIVAATATPAMAVSNAETLTLSSPGMTVPAAGTAVVSGSVKDAGGTPIAGRSVSFSGPQGTSFSPVSATTGGDGAAVSTLTTSDTWATPGSTIAVSAVSGSMSSATSLTVLGANIYASGHNSDGQLGTGSTTTVSTPVQVSLAFPSPVVKVASGTNHSLALLRDGTVWAVGRNDVGQLGDGTDTSRTTWAPVPSLSGVTDIAAAAIASYAVSGGRVSTWGGNWAGQLGNGVAGQWRVLSPQQISVPAGATRVAAGWNHAYALVGGSVYGWGSNSHGQLGDGTTTDTPSPVQVSGVSGATEIAAGGQNGYALVNGSVYAWGYNADGQIGDGTTVERTTATTVSLLNAVTQITAGSGAAYALQNGTVYSWGFGDTGRLGNGGTASSSVPVMVSGISNASVIAASNVAAYAIDGGVFKAWGQGENGQLGDGSTAVRLTPVAIQGLTDPTGFATQNDINSDTLFVLRDAGTLSVSSPGMTVPAAGSVTVSVVLEDANGAPLAGRTVSFSGPLGPTFSQTSAVTDANGLATSTLTTNDTWATPGSRMTISAMSGSWTGAAVLTVLGANAYGAGKSDYGMLGNGSTGVFSTPVQLSLAFPSPVVSFASGQNHTLALLEDGTVWAVGECGAGQLGDGTNTTRTTWAKVSTLTGVTMIAAAGASSYAVSNGELWSWGGNWSGQLGLGSTDWAAYAPRKATGVPAGVTAVAAGWNYWASALSGGEVFTWGANDDGQLGDGTTTGRNSPMKISGITGATRLASGAKTGYALVNGTVYAWGGNDVGQIGDGTTAPRLTPVTVSGITGATHITAGSSAAYALVNGTPYSWGNAVNGRSGTGTAATTLLTPAAVPGISHATAIAASNSGVHVIEGGVFKAWGSDDLGQLGSGSIAASRPTPITLTGPSGATALGSFNSESSNLVFFVR